MEREARILIIEDDPEYQEIISGLCEEATSKIDVKAAISMASDLEEAQRLLRDSVERGQSFDLVTIDINLRDQPQGGLKFLENLKASFPETCALIVSGEVKRTGKYEHILEALDKHVSAFLEKHKLDKEEFKRIVQGALYYAEAIEYKNDKRFRGAANNWRKAKELAPPKLNFPVNVGDILEAVMQNPITGLPSGGEINDRLKQLLEQKGWAVLKVRIDHLSDFYEHYGVTAGDAVLYSTAGILMKATSQSKTAKDFVGHTVQDRFILVTSVDKAEAIREQSVKAFNDQVGSHYSFRDREGGYKEVPLMSLEISIVTADDGPFSDVPELAARIAQA